MTMISAKRIEVLKNIVRKVNKQVGQTEDMFVIEPLTRCQRKGGVEVRTEISYEEYANYLVPLLDKHNFDHEAYGGCIYWVWEKDQ
jgi:hypothetical protein